ncbi:uncharacterized protein LOC128205461 [Mya arenaria]|uniref:uncharacterized protein LOC128205461 n=1 Tax=Mya arenaria TaxID=6604 RepID=UPI0022E78A05|nr:uncharacterized protein LOC128205461 [Mya arenaria]
MRAAHAGLNAHLCIKVNNSADIGKPERQTLVNIYVLTLVHGRPDINMLDKGDSTFMEFRKQQLDSRMKELTNRVCQITQPWCILFYKCKVFGFRGGAEHRNLQVEQYLLSVEPGNRILTFQGSMRKTVQGRLNQRKIEAKVSRQFEMPINQRCVVKHFAKFYWKQLPGTATVSIAFSSQVVGGNTLGTFIKSMFQEAGISTKCRNIRNHSGKVTLFIRLYKDSFDEQAIMSRSGHRSTAVRDYKRTSTALRRSLIDRLQPPMAPITTATAALATYLCEPTDVVSMPLSATTMSTLFATMKSGQKNAMRNIKTETSCQKTEQNAIEICMPEI